jgi:malonate decarboxylase gamma subunit
MMADVCYALSDAQIQVMNLPSMARITKIPLERLEQLSEHSPVFSPGVANYAQMGHLQEIWDGELAAKLEHALVRVREARPGDQRMALGQQRGGRCVAYDVVRRVEHAA